MSKIIAIKTIKGIEYITLQAHTEALAENTLNAKKKEVGYGLSSYRAEVIVYDRDSESVLQKKSSVVRTFKDIKLAVHWIRTFLIESEGDGDRVISKLYEVKERRVNDDGSPQTTLFPPLYSF